MINWIEKRRIRSFIFMILIAVEIFFFSSIDSISNQRGIIPLSVIYHFIVFFLFTFFLFITIKGNKKIKVRYIFIALIISILYAFLDEIHQTFIPGRNASINDILTDLTGSVISIAIYSYTYIKKIKRKRT